VCLFVCLCHRVLAGGGAWWLVFVLCVCVCQCVCATECWPVVVHGGWCLCFVCFVCDCLCVCATDRWPVAEHDHELWSLNGGQ
jgi:hypothetical protein